MFKAPKWVIKRIESLRRNFFWNGGIDYTGGGCPFASKNVCRSKKEGGLGILDLAMMNQAILAKWWLKFYTAPELQWNKIVRALYYQRRRPFYERRSSRPFSQWWKVVTRHNDIFKCGVSYMLGNEKPINLWIDRWCGDVTLQTLFPIVYEGVVRKFIRISECLSSRGWRWRKILSEITTRRETDPTILALKDHISSFRVDQRSDRVLWRWKANGKFTVKSIYAVLSDRGTRDTRASKLWGLQIPLKVQVFTCLFSRKDHLRQIISLREDGLCGIEGETVNHLFSRCVFSRFMIAIAVEEVQVGDLGDDVRHVC